MWSNRRYLTSMWRGGSMLWKWTLHWCFDRGLHCLFDCPMFVGRRVRSIDWNIARVVRSTTEWEATNEQHRSEDIDDARLIESFSTKTLQICTPKTCEEAKNQVKCGFRFPFFDVSIHDLFASLDQLVLMMRGASLSLKFYFKCRKTESIAPIVLADLQWPKSSSNASRVQKH